MHRSIIRFDLFEYGALLQFDGPPLFFNVGAALLEQCHFRFVFDLDLMAARFLIPIVNAQSIFKDPEFFFESSCLLLKLVL